MNSFLANSGVGLCTFHRLIIIGMLVIKNTLTTTNFDALYKVLQFAYIRIQLGGIFWYCTLTE